MRTGVSQLAKTLNLARSRTLGIGFPTVDEMISEAKGDIDKLRKVILKHYGINAEEKKLRKELSAYEWEQINSYK